MGSVANPVTEKYAVFGNIHGPIVSRGLTDRQWDKLDNEDSFNLRKMTVE